MAHKKVNLPEKICKTCQRPFSWRKKWEKNWEEVMYCSDKCRMNKIKKIKFKGKINNQTKKRNTDLRNKRNLKIFYELFHKVIPQRKLM